MTWGWGWCLVPARWVYKSRFPAQPPLTCEGEESLVTGAWTWRHLLPINLPWHAPGWEGRERSLAASQMVSAYTRGGEVPVTSGWWWNSWLFSKLFNSEMDSSLLVFSEVLYHIPWGMSHSSWMEWECQWPSWENKTFWGTGAARFCLFHVCPLLFWEVAEERGPSVSFHNVPAINMLRVLVATVSIQSCFWFLSPTFYWFLKTLNF